MKRRFRLRRRRWAASALLPLAAILTTTAFAADSPAPRSAHIDASRRSVAFGERVRLQGAFPGASKLPIELRYRAKGSSVWHTATTASTGASGAYRVNVRPRRSALWRAELAGGPVAQSSGAESAPAGVDADTGTQVIAVRSRIRARVGGRHAVVGDKVKVKGTVSPAGAQRRVVVSIGGGRHALTAGRNGSFALAWRAPSTGVYDVSVRARSNRVATGSRDSGGRVTVYRPAAASWYAPGLYGNPLACGGTLSAATMGMANKSLPCGTEVHLRYGSRSVTVPVIDRGPYAGNREYDLTAATKQALGFPDVGTVLTSR